MLNNYPNEREERVNKGDFPKHVRGLMEVLKQADKTGEVTLIQTHISWLVLAGDYVYKLKKPVDFGFLDFTTLEKRRRACLDELRLNKRLAPDIYIDVLSISHTNGSYGIGKSHDSNTIVDYCVKMVRFEQHNLFDRLLSDNRFNPEWMDSLATTISAFHANAESSPYIDTYGKPENLLRHIRESLNTARSHIHDSFVTDLDEKSMKLYAQLTGQLERRVQNHHIRDCHGDLHLKNITLYHDAPTPFDCIEFNEEFRMIDTMNDVAFLVMDCDARKRPDLGYRFLSRYMEQQGDYEGLKLLPLYLSYRAGVRGKVACLLSDDPSLTEREKKSQLTEAAAYFRLAETYLSATAPGLFAIGGLSGSGKSHLALQALQYVKAIIIRSDATRKRIAADHPDLPLYGKQMHELTYQTMFDAAGLVLKAGFSAILDATFLHPPSREKVAALAKKSGSPLAFFWLDVDADTLRERVARRTGLGNDVSDADLTVLNKQLKEFLRPQEGFITFIKDSGKWPVAS